MVSCTLGAAPRKTKQRNAKSLQTTSFFYSIPKSTLYKFCLPSSKLRKTNWKIWFVLSCIKNQFLKLIIFINALQSRGSIHILCHLTIALSVDSYIVSICIVLGMLKCQATKATPCILVYAITFFFWFMSYKCFIHLPLSISTSSVTEVVGVLLLLASFSLSPSLSELESSYSYDSHLWLVDFPWSSKTALGLLCQWLQAWLPRSQNLRDFLIMRHNSIIVLYLFILLCHTPKIIDFGVMHN